MVPVLLRSVSGLVILTAIMLSGCATRPNMINPYEVNTRAQHDFASLFSDLPQEGHVIGLPEAIARAIKYNLDNRLQMMESVLASRRLDLLDYQKLPQLAANAGYTVRNNRNASSSLNLNTGVPNFGASSSQDRGIKTASIEASWDTLDFGIAYLNAKQAGNDAMIAIERQRKMSQDIIRDVRYAYWRMVSASHLERSIKPVMREIREGLKDSYAIQKAKLKPLEECLEYQRALLDIQRQMLSLQRDIAEARVELIALIGLPPGFNIQLADVSTFDAQPAAVLPYSRDELQQLALRNRPELIEEDYRTRNALTEIRKARMRMIPGLELFTNYNYDGNSFLLNETWSSAGYRVSWNLLNLISGPAAIRHAKSSKELADLRRMALSMAVLTQVDVAAFRVIQAQSEFGIAAEIYRADTGMYQNYKRRIQAQQADQLSVLQAKSRHLVSKLRYYQAYAEWQGAIGQLNTSVGYQPGIVLDYTAEVKDLTAEVEQYLRSPAFSRDDGFYDAKASQQLLNKAEQYGRHSNGATLGEI